MPKKRILMVAGVVVALAGGLLAAFGLWREEETADGPRAGKVAELEAEASFSARAAFFGDTVLAHVDVLLDKTRVDPESVRVAADFAPFELIGRPERRRRDAGDSSHVRTTFVLRCLSGACVPASESERFEFASARVSFSEPTEQGVNEGSVPVRWPS